MYIVVYVSDRQFHPHGTLCFGLGSPHPHGTPFSRSSVVQNLAVNKGLVESGTESKDKKHLPSGRLRAHLKYWMDEEARQPAPGLRSSSHSSRVDV